MRLQLSKRTNLEAVKAFATGQGNHLWVRDQDNNLILFFHHSLLKQVRLFSQIIEKAKRESFKIACCYGATLIPELHEHFLDQSLVVDTEVCFKYTFGTYFVDLYPNTNNSV